MNTFFTTFTSAIFGLMIALCMLFLGSTTHAASNQTQQVLITSPLTATSTESTTISGVAYNVNIISLNIKGRMSDPRGEKYTTSIDTTVQVAVLNNTWSYTFVDGFPGREESRTGNGYSLTITASDSGTNKKLLTKSLLIKPKPDASLNVMQNKKMQYGYLQDFHSVAYVPITVSGNASFTDKLHVTIAKNPNPTISNAVPTSYSFTTQPKTVELPHTLIRRDWNISNINLFEGGSYTITVRNKSNLGQVLHEQKLSVEEATGVLYKPESVFAVNSVVTLFGTTNVFDQAYCRITNTNGQVVAARIQFKEGKCSVTSSIRTQGNYKAELYVGIGASEKILAETTFVVGVKPSASASITEPTSVTLGNSIQDTKISGTASGVNAVNLYIYYPTGGAQTIANLPVSGGMWSTTYKFSGAGKYTLRVMANGYTGALAEKEVTVSDAKNQSVITSTPTVSITSSVGTDYRIGDIIPISWTSTGVDKVYINWIQDRDGDGTYETVYGLFGSAAQPASGSVNWTIPDKIFALSSVGLRNRIKITTNTSASDMSSQDFSVSSAQTTPTPSTPTATIISPSTAVAGTLSTLSGTASGVSKVNITTQYPGGGVVLTDSNVTNGQWSITYGAPFTTGTYIITVRADSKTGAVLTTGTLVVTAPVTITPTATLTSPLTINANTAFALSGTASGATKVNVKLTNASGIAVSNTTPSVVSGKWSVAISGLAAGSYTVTVRADSTTGTVLATKTITVIQSTTKSTTISPLPSMNGFAFPIQGASIETANDCIDLKTNMHRGAESSAVLTLQKFLVQKGFLTEEPTAFYGDLTVAAVKSYQASVGLPQTGMVYEYTRTAMKGETCTTINE